MNQSGATAKSKEFSAREQASENQYARQKVYIIDVIELFYSNTDSQI